MQWERMTSPQLAQAAKEIGVCLLGLGVLERHGQHLPLGTDYVNVHRLCCLAAEQEPAVVFPPFYFGQVYEARCFPGAITLRPTLLVELWQAVLDEIGRNGFQKIILVNGHGGNSYLAGFIVQAALWEAKPYTLYLQQWHMDAKRREQLRKILAPELGGHAGASETSMIMVNMPDDIDAEAIPPEPAPPQKRLAHLSESAFTAVNWYADYPEHYQGDARAATPEMGRALQQLAVEELVKFIRAVKEDRVAPVLQAEFFARERNLRESPKDTAS